MNEEMEDSDMVKPRSLYSASAMVSLVIALVMLPFLFQLWPPVILICAVATIGTGHLARHQIRKSRGGLGGDRAAVVGLSVGYLMAFVGLFQFATETVFPDPPHIPQPLPSGSRPP